MGLPMLVNVTVSLRMTNVRWEKLKSWAPLRKSENPLDRKFTLFTDGNYVYKMPFWETFIAETDVAFLFA